VQNARLHFPRHRIFRSLARSMVYGGNAGNKNVADKNVGGRGTYAATGTPRRNGPKMVREIKKPR
jgi:hypothetical protein